MMVVGICKARNEEHIIKDTLDNWAQYCDRIHVYDDCSIDGTVEICRQHPSVIEVVSSTLMDDNRERAEWFNRQLLLSSAQRFMGPDDWVVYFDADEHLFDFDLSQLNNSTVDVVCCRSFDAYVTPEDADLTEYEYAKRRWVSPEWEMAWYFYRNSPFLRFALPDQRHMFVKPNAVRILHGNVRHWGKGLSVQKWEEKCRYYSEVFGPKYQAKWEGRKGKAVHADMKSDFGFDLVLWDDVRSGKAETFHRGGYSLVR